MKDLSSFERRIIDEIIRLDQSDGLNVMGNILDWRFNDHAYFIKVLAPDNCIIHIREEHLNNIGKSIGGMGRIKFVIERTSKDIFVAVRLFEYLENQGLIYSYGSSPLSTIGPEVVNAKYISTTPLPLEIGELLHKYIGKVVVPTQSLFDLRARGYRSEEEVRFSKTRSEEEVRFSKTMFWMQISALATAVATLASAVAIGVTLWLDHTKKPEFDVKLQANSAAISKSLKDISSGLGELGAALKPQSDVKLQETTAAIDKSLRDISSKLGGIEATLNKLTPNVGTKRKAPRVSPQLSPNDETK